MTTSPPLADLVAAIPREQIAETIVALAARLLSEAAPPTPSNGPRPPPVDTTLSAAQIAEMLGHSERWVYRSARRLPFLKRVGRSLVCSRRDLEAWREKQNIR